MSSCYQAISLFSGAGGLDIGFSQAGINVVWANDFDKDACRTYASNLGNHIKCGDLNDYLEGLRDYSGIDFLFGGPPCQGFSVAGKMDIHDPRSQLVWAFMKAVKYTKPKAFVMENVRSLASLDKFSHIRRGLIAEANRLGYSTDLVVLNAKNFGVPQSRERMFLVGVKNSSYDFCFNHVIYKYISPEISVKQAIKHLGPAGTSKNKRVCNAKITLASSPVLRKSPYAGMLFNGQGRPINPELPSCTLHASMGGNRTPIVDEEHLYNNKKSWIEFYHHALIHGARDLPDKAPDHLRRLTVDEAILLQTFPANYIFHGTQSSVYRQIGNAVPCNLAYAVAKSVIQLVEAKDLHHLSEVSPQLRLSLPLSG